ncbi:MAG: exopolyphosphatase [Gammaproteobacteria bacterium]|jgi:exopolyphosphatase/guanosine-5'-triphosphate,3'-diphosphate pyrophosphatase|nr:exopolyphosphatase [Gammaproteobacteria bacterium]MBU0786089.1 exopolyphosphatase [Gammaproteobacteria bacterium]MBU0816669.1 exopolyphosphatase [Gammaproteobacteria bacterium]MBU1786833.1 exopolyphosphatase [Gammaproteobacteria bacterium]
MQNGTRLAAVDLGSNSFRLEIGRLDHGQIHRNEYLKETVRQGNGLDEERNLTPEAMQRGWDCLARFGERLAGFKPGQVRAIATQTLREARNREAFLAHAQNILGFPIDVISGREEARLIYQGVAHMLPQSDERRLVVDIGGRSTELILGQSFDARVMESYRVGSVAWSMRYFEQGQFTPRAFKAAEIAAKAVLDEALNAYPREAWDVAYGSSGTIGAVSDVLTAAGWDAGSVTQEGLDWLLERLLKAQTADRLRMDNLKEDRRAVIGGGISVLRAVFDLLGIEEMHAAEGALRHGALYDLLDREHEQTDLRATSINRLALKFEVDKAHAQRVGKVARNLFQQACKPLSPSDDTEHHKQLGWAAQLHEMGSLISHSDYHKHGAYILDHADTPGFSMSELHRLSLLVLGHRGKLRKLELDFTDSAAVCQLLALRLAVILCHARREPDVKQLTLQFMQQPAPTFTLTCSPAWAQTYPQSAHLLREEVLAWQRMPCTLVLKGCTP